MSALKGSLSYARLYVQGELPDDFRQRFMKAMRLRAMKPLSADEDALERSGWCVIGEPFELDLHPGNTFYNDYINLGFRTDRWAVPAGLLRAKLRETEAQLLEKTGRERLSRHEKRELKELVAKRLRKQTVPAMRVTDLSWSLDEGIVRFFSQAPRTTLAMSELFKKTFNLELVAESPYTLAARLGLTDGQEKAWEELSATALGAAGEN